MKVTLKEINFKHHTLGVALQNLKLPFFFDKEDREFYRMEGYIYSYNYESLYRNFSVDVNLGLKIKTNFLMSVFMDLSIDDKFRDFTIFNSFLLKNGFSVNIKQGTTLPKMSDNVWHGVSHMNRFNRIIKSNFYDIDMVISTYNAVEDDDMQINSLPVVDNRTRSFSFHLMSMDTFTVISHKYYSEYRYFKRLAKLISNFRAKKLYIKSKNNLIYFIWFDHMCLNLNKVFDKNITSLSYYTYILKLYFFDAFGFINNILKYNLHQNNSLLFFYVNIFNKFLNYFVPLQFKFKLNNILAKQLKYLFFFYDYSNNFIFNRPLINNISLPIRKKSFIRLHYYKLLSMYNKPKKRTQNVYLNYNIRKMPAFIFSAVSRFPYMATGIHYTNNYLNYAQNHYFEEGIRKYKHLMGTFFSVVFSFFKHNLVKGVLNNNLLNPKFLIGRFVTLFKHYKPFSTRRRVQSRFRKFIKQSLLKKNLNKQKFIFRSVFKRRSYLLLNRFLGNTLGFTKHFFDFYYLYKNKRRNFLHLSAKIKKILLLIKRNRSRYLYDINQAKNIQYLRTLLRFITNRRGINAKKLLDAKLRLKKKFIYYNNFKGKLIWHRFPKISKKSLKLSWLYPKFYKNLASHRRFLRNLQLLHINKYWHHEHFQNKRKCLLIKALIIKPRIKKDIFKNNNELSDLTPKSIYEKKPYNITGSVQKFKKYYRFNGFLQKAVKRKNKFYRFDVICKKSKFYSIKNHKNKIFKLKNKALYIKGKLYSFTGTAHKINNRYVFDGFLQEIKKINKLLCISTERLIFKASLRKTKKFNNKFFYVQNKLMYVQKESKVKLKKKIITYYTVKDKKYPYFDAHFNKKKVRPFFARLAKQNEGKTAKQKIFNHNSAMRRINAKNNKLYYNKQNNHHNKGYNPNYNKQNNHHNKGYNPNYNKQNNHHNKQNNHHNKQNNHHDNSKSKKNKT